MIRRPREEDYHRLYALGRATAELRVSATEEFMTPEEFRRAIENPRGVFLVAEATGEIAGFIYAHSKDVERPFAEKLACLVYLAVDPRFRRQGIAIQLYETCVAQLKTMGITHVYGWANIESDGGIVALMRKLGFRDGHKYMWMDKKL